MSLLPRTSPKRLRAVLPPVVLALILGGALAGCGEEDDGTASDGGSSESASSVPAESPSSSVPELPTDDPSSESADGSGVSCSYPPDGQEPARPVEPPPAEPTVSGQVTVVIETSAGTVPATLDADGAPCTVGSFVSLAEQGFYDDTPCPRITTQPGFELLQCGDPSGTTGGGPGYYVPDELTGDETYPAGTLAMANIGQPDTNGSQFFIVYGDTDLPPAYTTFGTVDPSGLAVIEEVAAAGDDGSNPAGGGAPNQPIDIESVTTG